MIGETISGEEVVRVPIEERLRDFPTITGEARREYLTRLGELFEAGSTEEVLPDSYPLVEDRLPQWHFRNDYIRDLDLTAAYRDPLGDLDITDHELALFANDARGRHPGHGQEGQVIGFIMQGKLRSDDLASIIRLEQLVLDRREALTPTV